MEHTFTIEPGGFSAFADEAALIEQCKEWGLLSDKAVKSKAFVYKRGGSVLPCAIIGSVDYMTAVVEFENKQRHLIHPSLLKEMQASTYGQRQRASDAAESAEPESAEAAPEEAAFAAGEAETAEAAASVSSPAAAPAPAPAASQPSEDEPTAAKPQPKESAKEKPAAKKKSAKPQLPEEKVKLSAVVKEFATVPNHFAEEDDEVIIYENVAIVEQELELGDAWSSYSNTLKKFELEVGDAITFEAKIVAKKLTKHPVPYKINNPSKIVKG